MDMRARDLAQWLRVLVALAEGLDSVLNICKSCPQVYKSIEKPSMAVHAYNSST